MPEIQSRRDGAVLVLTIDNERRRNAFTHAMTAELGRLLREADDDDSVRCVILTGAGTKAFSSGHDLNEMLQDRDNASDESLNEPFLLPTRMKVPVIAAINGYAHAAGFILSISCDVRVCDAGADFAAPGARIGLLPIGGQISRLPSLMPLGSAFEILATGRRVGAEEALRIGLVSHVSEPGEALETAGRVARAIVANSAGVVAGIKKGLDTFATQGREAAERFEWSESRRLQSQPDAEEGMRAFLEKRSPRFA